MNRLIHCVVYQLVQIILDPLFCYLLFSDYYKQLEILKNYYVNFKKVDFASEISDTKYLKTYLLYPYIKEYLANQVNEHLEKCSIPRIKVNERSHLDNHSKFKNDVFTYQSLNFNSYRSVKDFFESAVRKVQGGESPEEKEYREHHLGRQFNKVYTRWSKTTKSESKWYGLTDIYNLEKYGGSATTFDTCVTSLLTIEGNLIQGIVPKYKIKISFKNDFLF